MRSSRLALAALIPLAALLTAACGTTSPNAGAAYGTTSQTASPTMSASSPATASAAPKTPAKAMLTVRKTSIGYVLATATGMTIYWYSDDVRNSGKSSCNSGCLSAWPAVTGAPAAAAGVQLSGKLGTITRPGGVIQATYNGYPLYTYANDMAPGQTTGNKVGGVWHVITGAVLSPAPASAAAASLRDNSSGSGSGSGSSGSGSSGSSTAPSTSASATSSSGSGYGW
jgi:predicted lipoprotein with Yx(FWY)xxD motif